MNQVNYKELPNIWASVPLGDIGRWAGGSTPSKSSPEYWDKGTIPWVSPKDMKALQIFDSIDHITDKALDESRIRLIPSGALLLVIRSGILQHSLPVAINQIPVTVNQDLKALELPEGIDPYFIAYGMLAVKYEILHSCTKTGTTVQSIELPSLKRYEIGLAPTNEQRRIVDKIDELFSDLDAGVAALERVRKNLDRYRASVLKAAVEGRLTADYRQQRNACPEPAEGAEQLLQRILKDRRTRWIETELTKWKTKQQEKGTDKQKIEKAEPNQLEKIKAKYKPPAEPDTTNLPDLPNGWCWASLEQICEVGTGTTPRRDNTEFWDGGDIPWIKSGAVNDPDVFEAEEFVTDKALEATTLRLYPSGTLIMAMYGEGKTRGKASELQIEATVNQALAAMVFQSASAPCKEYLKTFLLSNYTKIRLRSAGGVQPNLNVGLVKKILVPLPPLDEQGAICEYVNDALSIAENCIEIMDRQKKRAKNLRQSILKRAFAGKLVPQDPTDEPAEELLKRIHQQREAEVVKSKPKPKRKRKSKRKAKAVGAESAGGVA